MRRRMSDHDRKVRVWGHNALLGAAAMIESCADRIIRSDTTTPEAKLLAHRIKDHVRPLKAELKTRVDP